MPMKAKAWLRRDCAKRMVCAGICTHGWLASRAGAPQRTARHLVSSHPLTSVLSSASLASRNSPYVSTA